MTDYVEKRIKRRRQRKISAADGDAVVAFLELAPDGDGRVVVVASEYARFPSVIVLHARQARALARHLEKLADELDSVGK